MKRGCGLILALVIGLMAHAQERVVLVSDPYPPYVIDAPEKKGVVTDIAIRAFALGGIEAVYRNVPFNRAIMGVEHGTYDVILAVAKGGRNTLSYPEETLGEFRTAFFVPRTSDWRWQGDPRDLEGMRLGFIAGYQFANADGIMDYIQAHAHDENRIQLVAGNDALEKNLRKLLAGRIHALLDDEWVVLYTARQLGVAGQIRQAGALKPEKPEYMTIGVGRNHPRAEMLLRSFDRGVRKLRESGELDQIMRGYGLK